MKILVPVDGSKNSLNAVQFIGSRKTLLGSEPKIELLNVQLPLPARACRLVGQDAIQRYYEDEAEKVLNPPVRSLKRRLPSLRSVHGWRSRSDDRQGGRRH